MATWIDSTTSASRAAPGRRAALACAFVLAGCGSGSPGGTPPPDGTTSPPGGGGNPPTPVVTKVLFIGNSYTSINDLPTVFENLAADRGRRVEQASFTPGGNSLGGNQTTAHAYNTVTEAAIFGDDWDVVVLQEQSTVPTIPFQLENQMKPGAQMLDAKIDANDPSTTTLLFQTWARRNGGQFCGDGDCSPVFADFDAMQDALTAAYADVGGLIGAPVAPVGEAWRLMIERDPTLLLHYPDGSHPRPEGTYLAACVFYATIFDESPVGISYLDLVAAADAAVLQSIAARAVFEPTCGVSSFAPAASPANTLTLNATGSALPGHTVTLAPAQVPEAGWWCLSGFAEADANLFGGKVLVDLSQPVFASAFLPGTTPVHVDLPTDPLLAGLDLYFQALAPDAAQPEGHALSNGVRIEVCP